MKQKERLSIRYCIWDPSGNVTALAEIGSQQSDAAQEDAAELRRDMASLAKIGSSLAESETLVPLTGNGSQQSDGARENATELRKGMPPLAEIAAQIMKKHPEVEQVGFVRDITPPEEGIRAELFMAGGEFCGNAAMCAAAWYTERNRTPNDPEQELFLKVSGAEEAVKVHLQKENEGIYSGSVWMPAATGITYVRLQYGDVQGTLPLVRMQGISHLIIEEDSAFFRFLEERERAEALVRDQAEKCGLEGLGLMFLKRQGAEESLTPPVKNQGTEDSLTPFIKGQGAEHSLTPPVKKQGTEYLLTPLIKGKGAEYSLTPLVYIQTAGTLFWENSCGSGSSACGMYLAEKEKQPVDLELVQPGGRLRVRGDLQNGIRLSGRVKKTGEYEL